MKTSLMRFAIAAAAVAAVVGSSSLSARDDPVELKLTDLEARMIRIEQVVDNQSLIELANQLDQLRSETTALRGEIETLRHDTDGAASRQRELYVDVDKRLQSLERRSARAAFAPPPQTPSPPPASCRAAAAVSRRRGAAGGAVAAAPKPGVSDKQAYQTAFDLLQARKYDEATKAFNQFLSGVRDEPARGQRAVLARAVALRAASVQRGAAASSKRSSTSIRNRSKLPDALLKVGYCQSELGNKSAARTTLQQVMRHSRTRPRRGSRRSDWRTLSQEGG